MKKSILGSCLLLLVGALVQAQTWSAWGTGVNDNITDFEVMDSNLVAAGRFTKMDGQTARGMAIWHRYFNGQWQWDEMVNLNWVYDLQMFQGNLYAAGNFGYINSSSPAGCIAVYDQNMGWNKVGNGSIGGYNFTADVKALAEFNAQLVAGGTFSSLGGTVTRNIAGWDGNTWQPLGGGIQSQIYDGVWHLQEYNGSLYAAGSFSQAGSVYVKNVASWNGSAWSAVGDFGSTSLGDAHINAFAQYNGYLFAGGNFTVVNFTPMSGLVRFDGFSWSAANDGLGTTNLVIQNLDVVYGTLYASGSSNGSQFIARWDDANSKWIKIGTLTGGYASALIGYEGKLIAGGLFQSVNSVSCGGLAKYTLPNSVGIEQQPAQNFSLGPNPFSQILRLQSDEGFDGYELLLRNCLGEIVLRAHPSGPTYDLDRGTLRAGLYTLTLTREGTSPASFKVLIAE